MPDTPVEREPTPPSPPGLEWRVSRLEEVTREVKATLAQILSIVVRIEATLPHLATKAELAELRAELAEKPSRAYLWGVLAVLVTAYGAGLAAVAVLR
jgi:hypothetical protein